MLRKFRNDESGSATIEFLLWMPFSVLLLSLMLDASLLLGAQAHLWRTASDVSRRVALGDMTKPEAIAYAQSLAVGGQVYNTSVDASGSDVVTTISVSFKDVTMTSIFNAGGSKLSASVTQRRETN